MALPFTGVFIPVKYLDAEDLTLAEKVFMGYIGAGDDIPASAIEYLTGVKDGVDLLKSLNRKGYIKMELIRGDWLKCPRWYRVRSVK